MRQINCFTKQTQTNKQTYNNKHKAAIRMASLLTDTVFLLLCCYLIFAVAVTSTAASSAIATSATATATTAAATVTAAAATANADGTAVATTNVVAIAIVKSQVSKSLISRSVSQLISQFVNLQSEVKTSTHYNRLFHCYLLGNGSYLSHSLVGEPPPALGSLRHQLQLLELLEAEADAAARRLLVVAWSGAPALLGAVDGSEGSHALVRPDVEAAQDGGCPGVQPVRV